MTTPTPTYKISTEVVFHDRNAPFPDLTAKAYGGHMIAVDRVRLVVRARDPIPTMINASGFRILKSGNLGRARQEVPWRGITWEMVCASLPAAAEAVKNLLAVHEAARNITEGATT